MISQSLKSSHPLVGRLNVGSSYMYFRTYVLVPRSIERGGINDISVTEVEPPASLSSLTLAVATGRG